MKVTLSESGGFANITRGCTVDTDALPETVAEQLRSGCRAILAAEPAKADAAMRDARIISLEIVEGDVRRRISMVETSAPSELESVLGILRPYFRIVPGVRG